MSPATRVFVYRNIVKALPWFSAVRAKLADSRYAGWFLPFKNGVQGSYSPRGTGWSRLADGPCARSAVIQLSNIIMTLHLRP